MTSMRKHRYLCLVVLALASATSGCGGAARYVAHDAPYVEVLRIRISKVRNAIDETRQAIALARGARYLPELYLRLGELLSEEARYHYRVAYEREQRSTEALHVPQVRLLKEEAINVYTQLITTYPDTPLADRVLFNIAHEQRELGNFPPMIATLERLVREHPDSPLRFESLLVIGDYHFDKSELTVARRYYEQITAGELTSVSDMAHYKLAWVYVNTEDCGHALTEFEKAVRAARALRGANEVDGSSDASATASSTANASAETESAGAAGSEASSTSDSTHQGIDVRRSAIIDLAYCYSTERTPDRVLEYYRDLAHDRATYIAGLFRLSRRYATMNEANGGLLVARELLRLAPAGQDLLDEARTLHTAIRAREAYPSIGADVRLLTRAMVRYVDRVDVNAEERARTITEFELYARDLLTRAQAMVIRQADGPAKLAASTDLAEGFLDYVRTFPESEAARDMTMNLVDVLAISGRHYDAGHYAAVVAHSLQEGREQKDALYDAVVHFRNALDIARRPHVERVIARSALRRAATQLLRYPLDQEQERKTKFSVALAYYDEGNYREAIDLLTAVAYEFPQSQESTAAVNLVLDSYNILNDYDGLQNAAERFLGEGSPVDESAKPGILALKAASEQRMLDEVSLSAAGDEGGDLSRLLDFATRHANSPLGERALVNAFVAARAQGDTAKMYELSDRIRQEYPQSEQLSGILGARGQTAVARFEYDEALESLDQGAQSDEAQRVRLQVAAGELREQLGDANGARQAYEQAITASRDARQKVEPVDHLAAVLERQGNASATITALTPHLEYASPDTIARYGMALLIAGRLDEVEATMQRVLSVGASATSDALSRANLGMAEVLFKTVVDYPAFDSPDLLQEYITIVDVTQQSYLNAVRQGNAEITPIALGRLANLANVAAERVRAYQVPASMSAEERTAIEGAVQQRAGELQRTAEDARTACGNQAYEIPKYSPAVRACLRGEIPRTLTFAFDAISPRSGGAAANVPANLREAVARNPEDLEALRGLADAFLRAGDAHSARLVLATAMTKGGGALEQNLLGIASARVGDVAGAMESFSRAAQAGLEVARQNLVSLLRQNQLDAAAAVVLERIPAGREGGEALGAGARR